ncbi:F0F1 ATP synthase subunit epsilon [Kallotenue papyrolyticum]|uniref:F0F1 ATP synthase subunit epsilon n=1 Tax=Kallotenue papyrolyticum TaxID=1325125 RepID=UPI0004786667|nr:F0F1 ATP synthase subunit epsilon [Kallotenue papyrolyticum]
MPFRLEVVTAERIVLSDDVDQVNVPGAAGRMGIMARHEPLLTSLVPGEMTIIKDGERIPFAISGGFMEVLPDRVTILADTAERADEIDEARAEAARQRAEAILRERRSEQEMLLAEAQLRRALVRLQVARLKRAGRRSGPGGTLE